MSTQRSKPEIVDEVAMQMGTFPTLSPRDLLKTALEEMTQKRIGIVCIVDDDGALQGVFTDGDIRRHLLTIQKPFSAFFSDDVIDHAQKNPSTIRGDTKLTDALALIDSSRIWDLPVVDSDGRLTGLLHLHPLVSAIFTTES